MGLKQRFASALKNFTPQTARKYPRSRLRRLLIESYESRRMLAVLELASLTQAQGMTIYGAGSGDSAATANSAGDFNGDGYDDFIIGAYQADGPSNLRGSSGEAYLIFGGPSLSSSIDLAQFSTSGPNSRGVWFYGAQAGNFAGTSVAGVEDLNNDGFDEILIGASSSIAAPGNNGSTSAGTGYLVFGSANPSTSYDLAAPSPKVVVINGANISDSAGDLVEPAGDINSDGLNDFLVGASLADPLGRNQAGILYVIYGRSSYTSPINLASLGTNGISIYGAAPGDSFGRFAHAAGDVNGDGHDDIIVSAFAGDRVGSTQNEGTATIIYGGTSLPSIIDTNNLGTRGVILYGADAGDRFGWAVSGGKDFNGDGLDDLLVSAEFADAQNNAKAEAGESYLIYGRRNFPSFIDMKNFTAGDGVIFNGANAGDRSGYSVDVAGDINGDGLSDLIIGAYQADGQTNSRNNSGESYFIFGRSSWPGIIDLDGDAVDRMTIYGVDAGDFSGITSVAGDINGDGLDDLVIGASGGSGPSTNSRSGAGESYIIYGRTLTPVFAQSSYQLTVNENSRPMQGVQGNSSSYDPSISADGRHVSFTSFASNLVSGDTNGTYDIFVKDLQSGAITLVSTSSVGVQGNSESYDPSISADGCYVSFYSYASNLVDDDTNGTQDIFVKDLQSGAITRVSTGSLGVQGNNDSYGPSISANGRYVSFISNASNLVAGDTNGYTDIFVKDLQSGNISVASTTSATSIPLGQVSAQSSLGQPIQFSLSGVGSDQFSVNRFTGVVSVASHANLNFEAIPTYHLTVTAVDGVLSKSIPLTINLANVNEPPTDISLSASSVPENAAPSTLVGQLVAADPDSGDTFTYQFAPSPPNDNALFSIVDNQLFTNSSFDFETKNNYSIRVRATDAVGQWLERTLTIYITNVNEAPSNLTLSNQSIAENRVPNSSVGTLGSTDSDIGDLLTYSLVLGSGSHDNNSFVIVGSQLAAVSSFNFEAKSSYSIRVRSTDQAGLYVESQFTIQVLDVNEAPISISISKSSIDEGAAVSVVGSFTTSDPDLNESFSYAFASGAGSTDNNRFAISGNQLFINSVPDYETQASYSLRVRTTDGGGLWAEQSFIVQVLNLADFPGTLELVKDIYDNPPSIGSNPSWLTVVGSITYFSATSESTGSELWKSDGTLAGTSLVKDIVAGDIGSQPSWLMNHNGVLYFTAFDASGHAGLWKSDGTPQGTTQIGMGLNVFSGLESLTSVGPQLFFVAKGENASDGLWVSDGSSSGTHLVKKIRSDDRSGFLGNLTNIGGILYFAADDGVHGTELWSSDGTPLGTKLVRDINPGSDPSVPTALANANGVLFFRAFDNEHGVELWKSNGTTDGTILVKDIRSGYDSSGGFGVPLTNLNGTIYFLANDGETGYELWKSDGTDATTLQVKDIRAGTLSSSPRNLLVMGNTLYFGASSGSGIELWRSDGSTNGTYQVKDINPQGSGSPRSLAEVGGRLFFTGNDGTHGEELWTSDGTESGTLLVKDLTFGAQSTDISSITASGDRVILVANTPSYGRELHSIIVNSAPTAMGLSGTNISENSPIATVVGNFSAVDPDGETQFSFTIVPGSGGANNADFIIVGDQLRTNAPIDYEADSTREIRVRVTDQGGAWFEGNFIITVVDVAEDITRPISSVQAISQNATSSTIPISISGSDPTGPEGLATGVKEYELYVAVDNGPYFLVTVLPASSPTYTYNAASSHNYFFRSQARDYAGNVELNTGADTFTWVRDFDKPITQVVSATYTSTGLFTVQMTGIEVGGSMLSRFDMYVVIDDGVAQLIGSLNAGVANANGQYQVSAAYQGLADGLPHNYRFYSRGVDALNNIEEAPTVGDITVSVTSTAPTALQATGIDVQLGAQQRSFVRYADILFNTSSGLADLLTTGRIRVEKFGINATNVVPGTGTTVGASLAQVGSSGRLQLDFGVQGLGGSRNTITGDGFYRIQVDANGDNDFDDVGENFEFFRLLGDANGDGSINDLDTAVVDGFYVRVGTNLDGDLNGDGIVNLTDKTLTTRSYRTRQLNTLLKAMLDD